MSADALLLVGSSGPERRLQDPQNSGITTTCEVGPGAPQRPRAPPDSDECNRFAFGHSLAAILPVVSDQSRRQLEPDDLAANNGRRVHDISVRGGSH